MRWITFLILLYLMAALQSGKLGAFPAGTTLVGLHYWPEIMYLPMLAMFYSLYAAETAAPLAALACGLTYDLLMDDYVGTHMIPLALLSWVIVRVRLSIFREHAISQVIMTLLGVLAFAVVSSLFRKLIGAPPPEGQSVWIHMGTLAGDAVYTAIVAPLFFWLFFRFKHLLGFSSHGSRSRSHH